MAEKRFTPDQFLPSDEVPRKLRPFQKGEFVDNLDGTRSTERTATITIGEEVLLVPSLWMSEKGPIDLFRQPGLVRAVREFEMRTGKKFPRFSSEEEANEFARPRSSGGAVFSGPLEK